MSEAAERLDRTTIAGLFGSFTALMFLLPAAYMEPELAARTTGGLYQLAGIGTVGYGISRIRERFSGGKPGIFQTAGRYLLGRWHRLLRAVGLRKPKRHEIHAGTGMISGVGSLSATLSQGLNKKGSLEERVAQLQKFAEQLQTEISTVRTDLKTERRERIEAGDEERKVRAESDRQLRQDVEELAIGGLHLETAGVAWLVLGTALLAWPELSVPLFRFFHP